MTSTTPLLLLLDSILSQEPDRIRQARARISETVEKAGLASVPSACASASAAANNNTTLTQDVRMLLELFPNLASVPSSHDGSLPLHFAASIGNVEVAHLLLQAYPSGASKPNTKGKIPLHYAAREGRIEMVSFFLYHCPHTATIKSKKKKLAIHFAAGDGHSEVVRQLLRVHPQGASLPSAKGKLPLHFAARWGHIQIASDLLLVYPEGIRCVDWEGSLPLHDAAREGQVAISKFLIERYPAGLCVANIRSEIPLFPAVRSGNVDLVIMYLQGWSAGGMHILRNISADDNVQGWDWNIVELCLRGAVDNFTDCPLLEGKQPPALCCPILREDCVRSLGPGGHTKKDTKVLMDACCSRQAKLHNPHPPAHLYSEASNSQEEAATYTRPAATAQLCCAQRPASVCHSDRGSSGSSCYSDNSVSQETARSKSPFLDEVEGGRSNKKRSCCNASGNRWKRSRSGSWADGSGVNLSQLTKPKFIALHAALVCGASSHALQCVLNKYPEQVSEMDEYGRMPIHTAVKHPFCSALHHESLVDSTEEERRDREEILMLVLNEIVKPYPGGACIEDHGGRLPLHLALAARADFRLIDALVKANPSGAVKHRRLKNKLPIYMAMESDCDISTIYVLLRLDPSALSVSSANS